MSNLVTINAKTKTAKPQIVSWQNGNPEIFLPSMAGTKFERMILDKNRILANGDSNLKTAKNDYVSCGLSMAPHKMAGIGNVCSHAVDACVKACLMSCGNGGIFAGVKAGRILRTTAWYLCREWFIENLETQLWKFQTKAHRQNSILACRLNILSDIAWENYIDFSLFENTEFYDYTKNHNRVGAIADNYWVTLSATGQNEDQCFEALSNAQNVAVVFHDTKKPAMGRYSQNQRLPKTWFGFPVIDGDKTDARFDDTRGRSRGRVVGLRLKASNWDNYHAAIDGGFSYAVN